MGSLPDEGPVRLPPTLPPKRRRESPKWVRFAAAGLAIAMLAIAVASALNNEVSKRLATVPPSSTSPTTTIPVAQTTPVPVPQVLGARVSRPSETSTSTSTTTVVAAAEPQFGAETPSELIAALEKLTVEEEHTDGYARRKFGFYTDVDRDKCDTREEVIIAEATDLVMNTRNCYVQSGKWFSPFDGLTLTSTRDIDIAHLVPLQEAWQSGAWAWDDQTRNAYLNDLKHPETLLVVSATSREERKSEDPGGWLPSNEAYRCDYLKTWVYLKTLYKLSVDAGERESIAAAALYC